MRYIAVYESGPDNWSAFVPDIPGCAATGHDQAETARHLQEALQIHLDAMIRDGDPIPAPSDYVDPDGDVTGFVDVELKVKVAA